MDMLEDTETVDAGRLVMNEATSSPIGGSPPNVGSTSTTVAAPATPSVIDFTDNFNAVKNRVFFLQQNAAFLRWSLNQTVSPSKLGWSARSNQNSPYKLIDFTLFSDSNRLLSAPNTAFLYNITRDSVTLNLSALSPGSRSGGNSGQIARQDGASPGSWLGQEMVIRVDWSISETQGSSQSGVFTVVESYDETQSRSQMDAWLKDDDIAREGNQTIGSASGAAPTKGAAPTTGAGANGTSGPEETSKAVSSGGSSGGGLSTGAIAGIAVGGVALILIVAGLVWFLLRRGRQNKQETAYTPKQKATGAFMDDKDMHVQHAADSPRSPYSDNGQAPQIGAAPVPTSHGHGGTEHGGHTPYQPDAAGTRDGVSSTADHDGRRTETSQGVSHTVAHLVEEGMTADEIRHLEEEERQLDAEIERAGRLAGFQTRRGV